MSWNASKPIEEVRLELLQRMRMPGSNVAALCKEFGVSRKTAYKWKRRCEAGAELSDLSRRPHASPGATPGEVAARIVAVRKAHPSLGGGKIAIMLRRKGVEGVPSGTTVTNILRREGLLDKRAVAEAKRIIRFEKERPNEMWQLDFKGNFELDTGARCHPLDIIDDYSRYCIRAQPLLRETLDAVMPVVIGAFREYGMPETVLCDNGNPWGAKDRNGITTFEVWAMEHGVLVIHGRPFHPQTQGKDERFNKSVKREVLERMGPRPSLLDVMSELETYRQFYNNERPHYGIGGNVPSDVYRPSERQYADDIPKWEYPLDMSVRAVSAKGFISFRGRSYFVGEGLRDKRIGLAGSGHEDFVNMVFRDFLVGRLNLRDGSLDFMRCYRLSGDPRPFARTLV